MKKILCYGDSNTFGYNPEDGSRFPVEIRWTGVLQSILGNEYKVINGGCNNRTGFVESLNGFMQSAQKHFPEVIHKMSPIDVLIISLGTNDYQHFYSISEEIIEKGLEKLVKTFRGSNPNSQVIIIPALVLSEDIAKGNFGFLFDEDSAKKSVKYKDVYEKCAKDLGCYYLDLNKYVTQSHQDGLHYDACAHKIIAEKIAEII